MSSSTLTRPRPAPPPASEARGSVVLAGIAAAAWVIALSWAFVVGLAVVGWATAGSTASAATAIKVASQVWLLVHFVHLQLFAPTTGVITFVPLGLTAVVLFLVYRGGIVAARSFGAASLSDCVRCAAAFALPYATVAVIAAGASRTSAVRASEWQAAVVPGLLTGAVAWVAAVRHAGLYDDLVGRLPSSVRAVARAAVRVTALWLTASAALLAVAAAFGAARVQSVIAAMHPGAVGSALLVLTTLLFVPNGIGWASGYALGNGAAVGAAGMSPFAVTGGPTPALPPLAVLPQTAPVAALRLVLAALPVLALVGSWQLERAAARPTEPWWEAYARAAGLAVAVGGAVAALSAASAGVVGTVVLGPHPWLDGAHAAASVGAAALFVALLRTWRRYDPRVGRVLTWIKHRFRAARTRLRAVLPG